MKNLILLYLAVSTGILSANTYYVRTDGNNTHNGLTNSAAGAWLTIQKAADVMVAGDSVIVAAGNYAEKVTSKAIGAAGNPIVFQAASTGAIVGAFTMSHAYQVINGFTITGNSAVGYEGAVLVMTGANYLTVSNNTFDGGPADVYQLYVYAYSVNVTGMVVDKNSFLNANAHALILLGTGHTISGNLFTCPNGWDAVRVAGSNITFIGNTFRDWSNVSGNPNHTDLFQAFANGSTGAADDPKAQDILFEGNYFINCQECQLGNITDDNGFGNIARWTFRNNVFANISNTLNLFAPDFNFLNNTFYRCGANSGHAIIYASSTAGHANNLTMKNNIFSECGYPNQANRGWYGGDPVTGLVCDNNLVIGTGAGITKTDFATNGLEAHGINGQDPLFVNAAANDFRLQANSPCIGAGAVLNSQFTTDISNTTRGAAWDMGAYEFTTSQVRTTKDELRTMERAKKIFFQNPLSVRQLSAIFGLRPLDIGIYDLSGKEIDLSNLSGNQVCLLRSLRSGNVQKVILVK